MAELAPFRGLRYDVERVSASSVLAPPYDVIDEGFRKQLAAKDSHNCVHIILPQGEGDAKYQHARDELESWQSQGILVRDARPAIYRYHQEYRSAELGEQLIVRRGFVAAVKLHAYDDGVILRHERTLKGPKIDRLKLWHATRCHLSQIFTLYSDPAGRVDALFAATETRPPDLDGTTDDGTRHVMWRVDDPQTVAAVCKALADKKLYIADGHHRYETMLALRERLAQEAGQLDPRSAAQYGMMFLASADDPGLIVLPTHRLIHSVVDFDWPATLARLQAYFTVSIIAGGASKPDAVRDALRAAKAQAPCFAAVVPGNPDAVLLSLNPSVQLATLGLQGSEVLLQLDVTLLHELVLDRCLGIGAAAQEAKTNIRYIKDTAEALSRGVSGEGQVCFLMSATPVSQVLAVSDAGEVMPQKSTFFYPKLASGVVLNPVDPAELL